MEKEKKFSQIIVRMTEKEKNFLVRKAEEEERSISTIVRGALRERYREFGEIEKMKRGLEKTNSALSGKRQGI